MASKSEIKALGSQINVLGINELNDFLKSIPKTVTHKILQAAHAEAARPLISAERLLAPKRDGSISASIGVIKAPFKKANSVGEIKVGPRWRKGGRKAHFIEYGTKQRQIKGRGK